MNNTNAGCYKIGIDACIITNLISIIIKFNIHLIN